MLPAQINEKRHFSQRWRCSATVGKAAGGNNLGTVKQTLPAFHGPTQAVAEERRAAAIYNFLHPLQAKVKAATGKRPTAASSGGGGGTSTDGARPKRQTAPSSLVEDGIGNSRGFTRQSAPGPGRGKRRLETRRQSSFRRPT